MPARSMACLLCAGLAAAWWPGSAAAQETTTAQDTAAAPAPELASTDATSQAASADPADTAPSQPVDPWTITLSAGLSNRDDGPDGSWQTLSLTRQIGRGYVRGGVMRYHGTLIQADTALPSDYYVGTLGAGGNFDNWVIDGWASYGRQVYGKISTDWGSRQSSGARSSAYYALGGDFGRIFPLSPRWFVTPTIVGSYAQGRLLRPAPTGTGLVDLETREPTWTLGSTVRLDHAFGENGDHYAGISLSRNWTSNAVSQVKVGQFESLEEIPRSGLLDSRHYSDGWWEVGISANMKLADRLHLDLYASRSFDALAGNTISGGISLRKAF
ncbi:autotransporter outer membrane beta-barrel domain-containing protein [Novosphingobium lindaniclasticum]